MNRDNPVSRWLQFGAAMLFFVPIICLLLFKPHDGAISLLSHSPSWVSVVVLCCIAGYALACWLVVRRGQLLAAAVVVMICATAQTAFGHLALQRGDQGTKYQMDFGKGGIHHNIDVYCNGVHLGQTPFLLTEDEFRQKVKPRNTPPDQPRVIYGNGGDDFQLDSHSQWTFSPGDAFEDARDPGGSHYSHDGAEFFQQLKNEKYWWRFERDGCIGLRQADNSLSGGGGGSGGLMTYMASLWSVRFPSQRPHFNRLQEAARAVDYAPDNAWLKHFFRYQDFLEPELFAFAEQEPAAEKWVQRIAAARYDAPKQLTEATARRLLKVILDEAQQREQFMTPSLAYTNVQRIALEFPDVIAEAYRNLVESQQAKSSGTGMMSGNAVTVWYGDGHVVSRRLLLKVIAETAPPSAFDYLVWDVATDQQRSNMSFDKDLMTALGRYQRPEAEHILRRWLYDLLGSMNDSHGGTFDFQQRQVIDVMARLEQPGLQDEILQRVENQFPLQHGRSLHEVVQFFEHRMTHSKDLERLARIIGQCQGLATEDRIKFLWRIPTANSGSQLAFYSQAMSEYDCRNFLNRLNSDSNNRNFNAHPFAGQFIVNIIAKVKQEYPGIGGKYDHLLLQIDDDAARKYLETAITGLDDYRWSVLTRNVRGTFPHLNWMVSLIAEFETSKRKEASCGLLKAIGTDDAIQLLTLWSQVSRTSLSQSALQALKQPSQSPMPAPEKPIDQQLVKDADDLIAGLIQPDDLLPPATPAVWTGDAYEIPESNVDTPAKATVVDELPLEAAVEVEASDKPPVVVRPTIQKTIATLREQSETSAADFLDRMLPSAEKFRATKGWKYVFGRIVVDGPDSPRQCQSHVSIHSSGWFLGSVSDSRPEVGFHMFGYQPVTKQHDGKEATFVNVGDVIMKPYRFEELGTVRAQLAFEGPVDPKDVSVRVKLVSPKSRNSSGGTSGSTQWPDKEQATVSDDFRIQLTGLSPMLHTIYVKADKHQPFFRQFEVQPGGTTDVGVLRIPVSPKFTLEYATSETLDFSDAARHSETLFTGDRFKTNPSNQHYQGAGPLTIQEYDGVFRLRCGYYGCVQVDLGEGALDDFLKPVRPDVEKIRDNQVNLTGGHVYLIYHSVREWKHWTLIRVEMSSAYDEIK